MKRAFLVLGAQASGTRLMTSLLMNAGCWGDDGHTQRLDTVIPDQPLIAWRRSFPHGGNWPDVANLEHVLTISGYETTAIITNRDWHAMAHSQMKEPYAPEFAPTLEVTIANIQKAYTTIFQNLDIPFYVVSYEALVARPQQGVNALLSMIGLPQIKGTHIYDGNGKYYE